MPPRTAHDRRDLLVRALVDVMVNRRLCHVVGELGEEPRGQNGVLRASGSDVVRGHARLEQARSGLAVANAVEAEVGRRAIKPRRRRAPLMELPRILDERQEHLLEHVA